MKDFDIKKHTLRFELCTNSALFDVENEYTIRGIRKIPVPAVLPRWLLSAANGKRRGNFADDAESLVEEDTLILINDGVNLALDTVPDLVELVLASNKLLTERVKVGLDAELVVRCGVTEVQACGHCEIGLEDEGELGKDAFTAWTGVRDEQTRLCGIKDALRRVDKLANLKCCSPHCSLATCYGGVPVAVVEHLVRHKGATQSKDAQFDAADVDTAGESFIEDVEVIDGICTQTEFLKNGDVFARAPRRVDGDVELELASNEEREFRKHRHGHCLA